MVNGQCINNVLDAIPIESTSSFSIGLLFTDNRIKISNTKSIPTTDKSSFTTLMTLYDCHDELFKAFYLRETSKLLSNEKLKDYKRARPDDFVIQSFYDFVKSF